MNRHACVYAWNGDTWLLAAKMEGRRSVGVEASAEFARLVALRGAIDAPTVLGSTRIGPPDDAPRCAR